MSFSNEISSLDSYFTTAFKKNPQPNWPGKYLFLYSTYLIGIAVYSELDFPPRVT